MTYQHERDEFISKATAEGLDLDICQKLLRYATTLQRLAEARCNGDWPYNGDRDRPPIDKFRGSIVRDMWDLDYTKCPKCNASGIARSDMRKSGYLYRVGKNLTDTWVKGGTHVKVCSDCWTQELVQACLSYWYWHDRKGIDISKSGLHVSPNGLPIKAIFQGDPRGAVLRLATPNYPYDESGSNGARGLYVPARVR